MERSDIKAETKVLNLEVEQRQKEVRGSILIFQITMVMKILRNYVFVKCLICFNNNTTFSIYLSLGNIMNLHEMIMIIAQCSFCS